MEKLNLTFEELKKIIDEHSKKMGEDVWLDENLKGLGIPCGFVDIWNDGMVLFHVKGGIAAIHTSINGMESNHIVYTKTLEMIEPEDLAKIINRVEIRRKQVETMDYVLNVEKIKGVYGKIIAETEMKENKGKDRSYLR